MRRSLISLTSAGALLLSSAAAVALYGGTPVPDEEGAASVFFEWRARGESGSCSGVLVAERAVLTAGHCVRSAELGRLRIRSVRVGNPRGETVRRRVEAVHVHPEFVVEHPESGHDLALLLLREAVDDREPAHIATEAQNPSRQGQHLVIAGFGITRRRARRADSRTLRSIELEYLSPFQCFSGPVAEMSATRMCAASPDAGVCPGDSGSPALVYLDGHDVVVGIVSLAIDNRVCSDTATVLTRVAPFGAWIASLIPG